MNEVLHFNKHPCQINFLFLHLENDVSDLRKKEHIKINLKSFDFDQ